VIRTVARATVLLGLLCGVAHAAEREAPAEQLRQVEEERQKAEKVLQEIEQKQSVALQVLERVEMERREAEKILKEAHAKVAVLQHKLDAARDREEAIRLERVALAHDLAPRLLLRYRLRGSSYLQMAMSAPSIGDFLWRRRMVDKILQSDFDLIHRWAAAQKDEAAARSLVEAQQKELLDGENAARERGKEAVAKRAFQESVLKGLVKRKAAWEKTLAGLENQRHTLLQLISAMPKGTAELGGFGMQRKKLAWPVAGKIETKFGKQVDPKFHTVLQQKGYDFRAEEGTSVLAPYAAVVGFAGWFSGFGNLVILDHGEGYYTLYAHLKEAVVTKGQHVDEGELLGQVGDTGSLKGAYLYFEIRSGSKALDPAMWLRKK
jgi:septal ring factor EnvC (AmiA/AmiB activator)